MKILYFALISLMLTACNEKEYLPKDPHWKYNDQVKFEVPEFYKSVCKGDGIVIDKTYGYNEVTYVVENLVTGSDYTCFNAQNSFRLTFKKDD